MKVWQAQVDEVRAVDPEVADAIVAERQRQQDTIILIASENTTSEAVMAVQGSTLTNKYAEGYPGRRYYGGCEHIDSCERLARARAKELFGAEHANVQPHSGSGANMAVYDSYLEHGDKILALSLDHGGHLSHGHSVSFPGKWYEVTHYGVGEADGCFDYDAIEATAIELKPKLIICGASAYSRTIDFERFGAIAKACGARLLADVAHIAGLIVAGHHPSPFPHADYVTTTTHKTLRGPRGGLILCRKKYRKAIDKAVFPGLQGGPLQHVIAAKAVAFKEALSEEFKSYQAQVIANAKALSGALTERGFRVVSGGTDNHLFLLDMRAKDMTGKEAEGRLGRVGITVNKNMIPHDPRKPMDPSGIRLGTPTVTSRGMDLAAMIELADIINASVEAPEDDAILDALRDRSAALARRFPVRGRYHTA